MTGDCSAQYEDTMLLDLFPWNKPGLSDHHAVVRPSASSNLCWQGEDHVATQLCEDSAAVRVLEDTKRFSDLLSLWIYDSGNRGGGCIKHFLIAENVENALIERRS